MPETSTRLKLGAVADAIVARLDTIDGLVVYPTPINATSLSLPAAMVGDVRVERVGLQETELQLGSDNWLMTWTVTLYLEASDMEACYPAARELTGEVIAAVDADQTLGDEVDEAKLLNAETSLNDPDSVRRLVVIECELEALALVPEGGL